MAIVKIIIIIPILVVIAVDEPPNITSHPDSLKEVRPGKAVAFTVHATGTQPLMYEWQWKPAEEGDESEEWQSCDVEGPTLTIPRVQKSDEGQYRCVIYNHAGRQISKPAQLEVRDQPESNLLLNSVYIKTVNCKALYYFKCTCCCSTIEMWRSCEHRRNLWSSL